jgi:hypothetical protein
MTRHRVAIEETSPVRSLIQFSPDRTLAIMDNNGDKKLTKEEIKYGLQDYGIELNIRELDEIFLHFGKIVIYLSYSVLN